MRKRPGRNLRAAQRPKVNPDGDLRAITAEAARQGIPMIPPDEDCDEPHYKLYYTEKHWISVGWDGIEVTRGEDD